MIWPTVHRRKPLLDRTSARRAVESSRTSGARRLDVLADLGLIEVVTTIDGLSAVGAAAILAEAGFILNRRLRHIGEVPLRSLRPLTRA